MSDGKTGGLAVYRPKSGSGILPHGALWSSFSSESFTDLGGGYQDQTPSQIFAIGERGVAGETGGYAAYSKDFKYPLTAVKSLEDTKYSTIMGMSGNWMCGNDSSISNETRSLLWRIADDDTVEVFSITPDEAPLGAWGMATYGALANNPGVVVGAAVISNATPDALLWENFLLEGSEINYDYVNLHPSDDYWASECWAVYDHQQGGYVKEPPDPGAEQSDMKNRAALWNGTAESFQNLHPSIEGVKNSRIRAMAEGVQVGEIFYGDDILENPPCHAFLWFGSADDYVDLHTFLPDNYSSSYAIGVKKIGDDIHVVGSAINDNADISGREEAVTWTYAVSKPAVLSGSTWVEAVAAAQFSARQEFTVLVFDNKLWIIGGSDHDTIYGDVWYSADGSTWTQATNNAAFGKRFAHSSAVFDDKMWVIAGIDENLNSRNDVWCSSDGATWTQATENAAFSARYAHTSIANYRQMWLIGGCSGDDAMNDVWVSQDGATWTQATNDAAFTPRQDHASVYFNNKLWVIGGITTPIEYNVMMDDVWSSVDGVSWIQEADGAFEGRDAMALVAADGKMWMLGGWMNPHDRVNEVWYSTDGSVWTQVAATSDFTGRCELGGAYYQGKLWVMAGQISATHRINDVWYAE